jgi:hypothetical protein
MNTPITEKETTHPGLGIAVLRLPGVDQLPVMGQEDVCPIIQQYFDFVETSLTDQSKKADIVLLKEMLLDISQLLRSDKNQLQADGYLRMLNRLTDIYAKGLQVENDRAFAVTAANFADILGSVSQRFQDYDYSRSVSLLLHYMDKLFKSREESWLEVYEHLLSIPESIHVMQRLRMEYLNEIDNWIDEGVDNLFTLWDEQLELIAIQDQTLHDLELQILTLRSQLQHQLETGRAGVVDFRRALQQRELQLLQEQRDLLMLERRTKLDIVDLLESNIREFSDCLAQTRRSTLLKLAWSNPVRR